MVEVFKTNVDSATQSQILLSLLCHAFPSFIFNFDLSDCDRILRVEGNTILPEEIIEILMVHNKMCELLEGLFFIVFCLSWAGFCFEIQHSLSMNFTSTFSIPCSIFDIQKKYHRRESTMYIA